MSSPPRHRPPPTWLRALGRADLPREIRIGGWEYELAHTFKHDFFAATGLYKGPAGKVVLKLGRQASMLGIPMNWIGGFLARHEARTYQLMHSIQGVPRFVGLWGQTGLVHEFIEGRPLQREDVPDDRFFPRLREMLNEIHARDAAYVDLEKRENILLGDDGAPFLIDFQISWYLPARRGGRTWLARLILSTLQASDHYHLLKHWRRLRPDQLETGKIADSYRAPFWIRWHRAVFRPLTRLRRHVLVCLGARTSATGRSPG
ncbi:MAG: hypothetical protein JXQ75_08475 [Phycisphaerae bacterium]|nr:hypothetical protein [Phycisphaerae bacterium]